MWVDLIEAVRKTKSQFGPQKHFMQSDLLSLLLDPFVERLPGGTFCYPDPAKLAARLRNLSPVRVLEVESVKDYYQAVSVETLIGMLTDLVETYARAYQNAEPFVPVYLYKKTEDGNHILRDDKGEPIKAQEKPVGRFRRPCLRFSQNHPNPDEPGEQPTWAELKDLFDL